MPSSIPLSRPRPFEVRTSKVHGKGAFAARKIKKGERLVEYVGERITNREADRRAERENPDGTNHTFLFTVDDKTIVDASKGGNPSRFINHSCSPNCESVIEDGRIYIDAIKDIAKGKELFYDYCMVLAERHTPAAKKLHPCRCGARNCRKTLLAPKR